MSLRFVLGVGVLVCACFFLAGFAPGQSKSNAVPSSGSVALETVYSHFVGEWTGELEYRDYSTNERVKLPTWLDVRTTQDGSALLFHYVYDDGPNKVVEETDRVTIDLKQQSYEEVEVAGKGSTRMKVSGLEDFAAKHGGVLVLTGTGTENDKPVDVRITLRIGRNIYRFLKETRPSGSDFQFRDAMNFTRREPPQPTK